MVFGKILGEEGGGAVLAHCSPSKSALDVNETRSQ